MHQNAGGPKFRKSSMNIGLTPYSNSNFYVTTGLIFFIDPSIDRFILFNVNLIAKSFTFKLASESWYSEISRKCYRYWHNSPFELMMVRNYRFDSFYLDFNRKLNLCRKGFEWFFYLDRCIRFLIVLSLQKTSINIDSSWDSNTNFLGFCSLDSFNRGLNRKLKIFTGVVYWKIITSVRCLEIWWSEFSRKR